MRKTITGSLPASIISAGLLFAASGRATQFGQATAYFQDKDGVWWDACLGNDKQSPFREKPAIVKIDFDRDGKIQVAASQPDFVLHK